LEKDRVPQDDANMLEGKLKVLKYAVDKEGRYTHVKSVGWEPENIVLSQAWEAINEKVEEVRQKVLANKVSPIAYHMEKQMLDMSMLSGYTGFSAWRIRLHIRPWFFNRLSDKNIQKYAQAFRITTEELKRVD
jgi:hypothetical protein